MVQSNPSLDELNTIPVGNGLSFQDGFAAITPFVTAWKVIRHNHETGQDESVPPRKRGQAS